MATHPASQTGPTVASAILAPLGLIEQDTINEFGEIVPKWQLTHDQSFNVIKQTSRSAMTDSSPRISHLASTARRFIATSILLQAFESNTQQHGS
jgi:hypothetical protein